MRIKVFSLSLSTWYQSQGRKLYSFWFTRVINSGNPFSDRVSFRSPFPSPKAFRSATSWSENPHHRQHFSGDTFQQLFRWLFPDDIFRHWPHHQERKEEICNFSQSTGAKNQSTRRFSPAAWIPRADTWGRVAHFPVSSFFQQARPAPSYTSKPLSILSEPYFSIFFPFQPPRVFFQLPPASDGSSIPWPRPVRAWEGLFFIPSHFSPLFGSRHTRFFFHNCDPTSL